MRDFKCRVVISEDDYFPHSDPHLAWNAAAAHRLDYICAVGSVLGVHASLTNDVINGQYEFQLLPRPYKKFSGKYAQLGSDQAGALIHIGTRPGEEVYLFMAPSETLDPSFNTNSRPGLCSGPTTMQEKHARVIIAFIASCLADMVEVTSVWCESPYDIPMPPRPMTWTFTSAL